MTETPRTLWRIGTLLHLVVRTTDQRAFHYTGYFLGERGDFIRLRDRHDGQEKLLNLSFVERVERVREEQ